MIELIQIYHEIIEAVVRLTGLTHDALHVHAGLALFLLAQLAIGTRRGSLQALNVVVVAALVHETTERLYYGSWRVSDTLGDIVMTVMWPVAVVAVSRYRRRRWELRHMRNQLRAHALAMRSEPAQVS